MQIGASLLAVQDDWVGGVGKTRRVELISSHLRRNDAMISTNTSILQSLNSQEHEYMRCIRRLYYNHT